MNGYEIGNCKVVHKQSTLGNKTRRWVNTITKWNELYKNGIFLNINDHHGMQLKIAVGMVTSQRCLTLSLPRGGHQ